jgi:hypothetical protein
MNQRDRILDYLKQGNALTRLNAWNAIGVLECPARISELRAAGHNISTTMRTVTNRYGEKVRIAEWRLHD